MYVLSSQLAVPPSIPECKVIGESYIGNNVTLLCHSTVGRPAPQYKWSEVRSATVTASPRITLKGIPHGVSLSISSGNPKPVGFVVNQVNVVDFEVNQSRKCGSGSNWPMVPSVSLVIYFKQTEGTQGLYMTLVRLHLKYCIHFCLPHSREDVEALEKVQRKITRMLPGLECFSYREQLD